MTRCVSRVCGYVYVYVYVCVQVYILRIAFLLTAGVKSNSKLSLLYI